MSGLEYSEAAEYTPVAVNDWYALLDVRRARTLYIATVALTLVFSCLYLYTDIALWTGRDFGLGIDSPFEIFVAAMTLHYTYHGTDILAMYTLLLLVAPLILLLLSVGEWYWVLGVSWLWWLIYQFYPEEASIPWYIRHGENFPVAAWQVLFVTGHVLGFYRDALGERLRNFRRLRVALPLLARKPQGRRVKRGRRIMRALTRSAGTSRDLDVGVGLFEERLRGRGEMDPERRLLRQRLRAARGRSRVRMAEALMDIDIGLTGAALNLSTVQIAQGDLVAIEGLTMRLPALG